MPVYRVTVGDKEYTVEVPNPHERPVRAIIEGETIEVHVETQAGEAQVAIPQTPATTVAPTPVAQKAPVASGAGKVTAPLPGVVVSISVSQGDKVEVGQELCVLEAMKMNNPIRATAAGTVTEIYISIGQQVQHSAPLMKVEAGDA